MDVARERGALPASSSVNRILVVRDSTTFTCLRRVRGLRPFDDLSLQSSL